MSKKPTEEEIIDAGELENKVEETPPPKIVRLIEELAYKLNPVEWGIKAEELSQAHQTVIETEERKKSQMSQINSDLKTAKARETKIANIVATHNEYREVTVEVKYDYETGKVTRTRLDTQEVISERDMTDSERQLELVQDANGFIEENRKSERRADDRAAAEEAGEIEDIDDGDLA